MKKHTNVCIPSVYEENNTESPVPEESGVRLSSKPPCEQVRKQVADLINGRFLGMYQLSLMTHDRFRLLEYKDGEGEKVPQFPTIGQVADSFSQEELSLALNYQKPALLLTPPSKSCEDLFAVISSHYNDDIQKSPLISSSDYLTWSAEDEFRTFIVEGTCKINPYDDSLASSLGERIRHKVATRKSEEWGMSGDLYALLAMQSIVRGQMIDKNTFTVLDGEPIVADRFVPVGHCNKQRPIMEWQPSDICTAGRGRFRRVLGGRSIIGTENRS